MAVASHTWLPRWSAVHQGASQPTGTTGTWPTSTPRPCLRTGASASITRWPTPGSRSRHPVYLQQLAAAYATGEIDAATFNERCGVCTAQLYANTQAAGG
jgi:hypothetical protein